MVDGLFAVIVAWNVYGKNPNPHQAYEDRLLHTSAVVKAMAVASIAVTVFLALSIILSALDMRHLQALVQSVYLQLLAVISLQVYFLKPSNFEVYREDPVSA